METGNDKLDLLTEMEHKLVDFHMECKELGLIPAGFKDQWADGMNLIQMCLMAHRSVIREPDREILDFS